MTISLFDNGSLTITTPFEDHDTCVDHEDVPRDVRDRVFNFLYTHCACKGYEEWSHDFYKGNDGTWLVRVEAWSNKDLAPCDTNPYVHCGR